MQVTIAFLRFNTQARTRNRYWGLHVVKELCTLTGIFVSNNN